MRQFEFTVPGKPRSFQRVAQSRAGFWFDPCKKEKKVVAEIALEARLRAGVPLLMGPVSVTGYFHGLRSNQDLDNVLKLAMDAMNKVVYEDDRQVDELHAFRCKGKPDYSHIYVKELEEGSEVKDET